MNEDRQLSDHLGDYKTHIAKRIELQLDLDQELIFTARTMRGYEINFDASVEWGCMPTEGLLAAAAGCMAIDIVSFLRKMRCTVAEFRVKAVGHRHPSPPQYFKGIDLQIMVKGEGITKQKMKRAVELSKGRYCSVYHTLRPDLEHRVTWEILAPL